MTYISCFSGIGGLEGTDAPIAVCEVDEECQKVLSRKFPSSEMFADIADVHGITSDTIVGGWPCQDLSIAGNQQGLIGKHSRLFYSFISTAVRINAGTIVAENVPNLLRMDHGNVFREVVRQFQIHGYKYCSWRTLNARQFGLPHNRARVFIIASVSKDVCFTLFRDLPEVKVPSKPEEAAGFYWTAGTQSINYSKGFTPTIKIGSSLSISSPPAVHYEHIVRQLTPLEALKLQGFDPNHFESINPTSIYQMTGNAVAMPVGRFVVDGVLNRRGQASNPMTGAQSSLLPKPDEGDIDPFGGSIPKDGFYDQDIHLVSLRSNRDWKQRPDLKATNLIDFLDVGFEERLSKRAATGLLRRLSKSGLRCPPRLKVDLEAI